MQNSKMRSATKQKRALITGGAGFIGSNLADYLVSRGQSVVIADNLSRKGTEKNIEWLQAAHKKRIKFCAADIRDANAMEALVKGVDVVYHLAAQVAVTSSVADPVPDFEINARGTLNVLEAVRKRNPGAIVIFSSTNKVYGEMEDLKIRSTSKRYVLNGCPNGVPESRGLDFHSPYGCSKGAADQYVRDFARIYGLRTIVFRQSCIYGPRQFGNEDQGWLAFFVIAAVLNKAITIYGDGKQVRDLLYVDDLIEAFQCGIERIDSCSGGVYNIGGGPENSMSIWREFGELLSDVVGARLNVKYGDWRPGDQRVYISDIRKAKKELGWTPKVSIAQGVEKVQRWVKDNQFLFQK